MFKAKGGGIGEENRNIKKREKGCEGHVQGKDWWKSQVNKGIYGDWYQT